ncbi:HAD family acid phosphatase [Nocardioides sp. GXZ039]|uniref:HAD family acid phosphatase n=1 Tax=Nocardioides sp. GXZ039 TaxID=3136018 RepID=UPI0030F41134
MRTRSVTSMRWLLTLVAAVALAVGLAALPGDVRDPTVLSAADEAAFTADRSAPVTERQWREDVRAVMKGSRRYLHRRAARATEGEQLAINLDVDNTMLATEFATGRPVRPVLRFARTARRLGIAVFVNTAREESMRDQTVRAVTEAGYDIDGICLRKTGLGAEAGKQRCRRQFRDAGYVLVANVGNYPHDFSGGGYERAYRLPNYHGQLS